MFFRLKVSCPFDGTLFFGEVVVSIYDFEMYDIQNNLVSLSDYKNKVVLIVNTASNCGFTPQFKQLETLYQEFKESGFEILGFPCNQFMEQDKGSNEEILSFCQINYGVTFKMFSKIEVNGENVPPLYQYLKKEKAGLMNSNIKWNFTKFLVDKNGVVVKRYSPQHSLDKIKTDIQKIGGFYGI